MRLLSLKATKFLSYKELDITFAPSGVTLIVGDNGAGKSALIEACVFALYGKTLRGVTPIGEVTVRLVKNDVAYTISRKRAQTAVVLTLTQGESVNLTGATPTETQMRIDALFGTLQTFKTVAAFSQEFMQRFGAATDKERKVLLEQALSLPPFDAALERCRRDLRERQTALAQLQGEIDGVSQAVSSGEAALVRPLLTEHELGIIRAQIVAAQEDVVRLRTESGRIEGLVATLQESVRAASQSAGMAKAQMMHADAFINRLTEERSRARTLKVCPLCSRPLVDINDVEAHLSAEIEKAVQATGVAQARYRKADTELRDQKAELDELLAKANDVLSALGKAGDFHESLKSECAKAEIIAAERHRANALLDDMRANLRKKQEIAQAFKDDVMLLECAVEVLGVKGARVLMLGKALARLEIVANGVLSRLSLPVRVTLGGVTRLKSDKTVDTVSVTLMGAGGGDYDAASRGERCRVDVALMLGLMCLTRYDGILLFDEVFDSLDRDGVERVAAYLQELAQTRQVVVVSHHDDMKVLFPRADTMRVVKGESGSVLTR